MISVIIASADSEQLKQVTQNITATIGTPFEIIKVDNSKGQQGICKVYNNGISRAKYDILCFMHEDVIIKTQNWGQILIALFNKNPDLGLLGIVGGGYKPFTPSGWVGIDLDSVYANVIQSYKYSDKETHHDYRNPNNVKLQPVACVDGVWLATLKKIALETGFDENTFKGFHAYDVDFSIAVGQRYQVAVTYDILLNHLSEGNYSREWVEDTIKLHEKWKPNLPVDTKSIDYKKRRLIEKRTFNHFVGLLIKFEFPMSTAIKILWENKKYREMNLLWKLQFLICKTYLKRNK